jgi:hypothetical protein
MPPSAWFCVALLAGGCLPDLVPVHSSAWQNVDASVASSEGPTVDAGWDVDLVVGASSASDLRAAPQSLALEAEGAALTAPMAAAADKLASGGQYIAVPAGGTGGKAVFTLNLPAGGDYTVWGRVIAPSDANNSFHVSVDQDTIDNDGSDGVSTIWDLPIETAWTWVKVSMRVDAAGTVHQDLTFQLAGGSHTLYLNEREELTQLDQLLVTSDPTPPTH